MAVGIWRRMSVSCPGARVVCGVDPMGKSQQVLSHLDNTSSNLARRVSVSSAGDAAARCQAATMTAVRETAEVEMRCLEDSRAALRGSFEAASASGCEECRPEAQFLSMAVAEERRVHHGRRGGGDWYPGLATTPKPAQEEESTASVGKGEMLASFEAALQEVGRNAEILARLAVRAWRMLGDPERAEALYVKALELAPEDSALQASYAEFLWQCDV